MQPLSFRSSLSAPAEISAPKLSVTEAVNIPTPLPCPCDESANAMAEVDAALARVGKQQKGFDRSWRQLVPMAPPARRRHGTA